MAFAHYGPFWRQMRKVCVMKVFSRKRAESWASVRDEVDKMVRSVSCNVGKLLHIFTTLAIYVQLNKYVILCTHFFFL